MISRFGPDPQTFFEAVYRETAPWDIGTPQPALTALFDEFPPESPVLEVGCGSGDLAIHLAQRGLEVLGIDFVDTAIAQAREKASALPPEVTLRLGFQVADGLQPSLLGRQFASVVDSGFFHLFDPEQGDRFVDELARTLFPGGRYYLLAFAIEFPIPNVPRRLSEEELRVRFTAETGWRFRDIRRVEFLNRVAPTPAICACVERLS